MEKQLYSLLVEFIAYAEGTKEITATTEHDFYLLIQQAKELVKLYEKLYIN